MSMSDAITQIQFGLVDSFSSAFKVEITLSNNKVTLKGNKNGGSIMSRMKWNDDDEDDDDGTNRMIICNGNTTMGGLDKAHVFVMGGIMTLLLLDCSFCILLLNLCLCI